VPDDRPGEAQFFHEWKGSIDPEQRPKTHKEFVRRKSTSVFGVHIAKGRSVQITSGSRSARAM